MLSNTSLAEIVTISPDVKIKIPDNKTYYTENSLERVYENLRARKFTKSEINFVSQQIQLMGYSGNEMSYEILSERSYFNKKKREDEFEQDELFLEFSRFARDKCSGKKNKSSKKCLTRAMLEFDDSFDHFMVVFGDSESEQLKKLNGMSDDELATLSRKDIKKIRKIHSNKIDYKYKNKFFKEKGVRNIKITGDGFFYIERISSINRNGFKYTETSWSIPFKNREFIIKSFCYEEYCEGIKEKMTKIVEPTFKINPNGIKTYDFQKKQDMLDLIEKVRKGYRIFKIAKLLLFII